MHLLEIALSVVLGLATSFAFFYWQFHIAVPRVRFSEKISKLPLDDGGYRYRIKYENPGRRAMLEVTLVARLRVPGIRAGRHANIGIATIPMEGLTPRVPALREKTLRPTPELELQKTEFDRTFPRDLVERAHRGGVSLEELLTFRTGVELFIYLFAFDEFSGSRTMFESKRYNVADIAEGEYVATSLEIERTAATSA